jgi:hypothetical protein
MPGVFLGLVFAEQRHDLTHHDRHWVIAHLLGDRDQLGAVLRQLADVEFSSKWSRKKRLNEWKNRTSNSADFDVPASIMRWNSGEARRRRLL